MVRMIHRLSSLACGALIGLLALSFAALPATAALTTLVLDGRSVSVVASLLNQSIEASLKGRVGERFLFELGDALENVASLDPGNAGWQRDLVVSNYKLANHLARAEDPAAANYWRGCHTVLRHMKARGMFLDPPLVSLLEQLDRTL